MSLPSGCYNELRDALSALGIEEETIVFPLECVPGAAPERPVEKACGSLNDTEWALIKPHVPADAAQAKAMSNRELIEAVLWALAGRKAGRRSPEIAARPCGKRSARWAHAGFWQRLYESVRGQGLAPAREAQLGRIAQRAAALKARKSGACGDG